MGFGLPVREVDRGTFARFQSSIDPSWVLEALAATGTATLRRRRFPAEQVVWLVLGMALFRDIPIVDVVANLGLVLPGSGAGRIAASAVMQARAGGNLRPAPAQVRSHLPQGREAQDEQLPQEAPGR